MEERPKKLLRQFKRYLGFENSEDAIGKAVAALRAGNAGEITPEQITILENFPKFVDSVQNSYNEYEDRLKIATRNIELSSKELTSAYANLESLNVSINAMLDSLGQGLLFFNNEGVCSPVFSKSCLTLLEIDPSHRNLSDVLNFSSDDRQNFLSWLPIVFSDSVALDFDDMKKLLPGVMVNGKGQTIEIDYRPMYLHEDTLIGILLIATDVTYRLESEAKMHQVQMEAHKIQQIARNRNGFHRFLCDLYAFIGMAKEADPALASAEDRSALLRQLHTFKGYASTFSLTEITEKIHDIEGDLKNLDAGKAIAVMQKTYAGALEDLLEQEKSFARTLFGSGFMTQGRVLTIEMSKIEEFSHLMADVVKDERDRERISRALTLNFLTVPIFSAFLSFERELARMAELQGKAIPDCHMEGDNLPIVYSEYENFFNVLIHLARNIVDHGLETSDERLYKGKPREGQVRIHVKKSDNTNYVRISISDDGQGIDAGKIRHKLKRERNLDLTGKTDEEILQYIFDPEFSLRKEATMVSGRGMGTNAIQDIVVNMGGSVHVTSGGPDAQGTTFIFELPYRM